MRNLYTLDRAAIDQSTGIITFSASKDTLNSTIAMRQEGEHVAISASFGAFEVALRLRLRELVRTLHQLQPNDGLVMSRQVGSGNCFLGLGLRTGGAIVLRPTIVGDATGYFCLNFLLAPDAAAALNAWIAPEA